VTTKTPSEAATREAIAKAECYMAEAREDLKKVKVALKMDHHNMALQAVTHAIVELTCADSCLELVE